MPLESPRRYMNRAAVEAAGIDVGLRQYMLRVYNYMASGLALTGIVSLLVVSSPTAIQLIFGTGLFWVVALAPIALVFFLSMKINSMKASTAQTVFWIYAGLMGLSLASIFLQFTGVSVARVFFITAGTFAAMSLWGYTTKKDLSGMGSFLFMGLIGILIASVVNIFLQSSMMHFVISAIGVVVFTGLTAWDTQRIKETYSESDAGEVATKKAVFGALTLYLDFINLFLFMLQFLGERRE